MAAVILTLSSEQFVFAQAQVLLLRTDNPEANIAQGHCRENVISDLNIHEPATYNLWLSEIEVRTSSNGKSVRLNRLLIPWVVEFTQEDLDRGTRTVLAPGGVFRITVVDGRHIPVPSHKLMMAWSNLAWANETTIELQMDAKGMYVTYDNPTQCLIIIDPGFGVLIEQLDTAAL